MANQPKGSSQMQHRCSHCGKSFNSENELRQHEKSCTQSQTPSR